MQPIIWLFFCPALETSTAETSAIFGNSIFFVMFTVLKKFDLTQPQSVLAIHSVKRRDEVCGPFFCFVLISLFCFCCCGFFLKGECQNTVSFEARKTKNEPKH